METKTTIFDRIFIGVFAMFANSGVFFALNFGFSKISNVTWLETIVIPLLITLIFAILTIKIWNLESSVTKNENRIIELEKKIEELTKK